ncbi:hypothetical protein FOCC_FOCC011455, partial [Frankliniella occidentalis]
MSILYQRREPPAEGEQVLIGYPMRTLWKDPRKEENKPLPMLESEKGARMPSWGQVFTGTTIIGLMATLNHL